MTVGTKLSLIDRHPIWQSARVVSPLIATGKQSPDNAKRPTLLGAMMAWAASLSSVFTLPLLKEVAEFEMSSTLAPSSHKGSIRNPTNNEGSTSISVQ